MKKFLLLLLAGTICSAHADELKKMLEEFKKEDKKVSESWDKAETQLEITAAAGEKYTVAEKQFCRVLDYKLRQTKSAAGRVELLETFLALGKETQKILDESYEKTGSIENTLRFSRISLLMDRQCSIWLADKETAARWNRVANASGMIGGKKITLKNGRAEFETVLYGSKVTLEIILFPGDVFTRNGKDFARITTDIPKPVNDDFMSVYLCEIKDGKIISARLEKSAEE